MIGIIGSWISVFFFHVSYLFVFNNFVSLFLAVLGLHCCSGFSLVAESGGYFLVVMSDLLIAVAPLFVESGSSARGSVVAAHELCSTDSIVVGTQAQLLHSMGNPPGSRIEPVPPALEGGFFHTESPGKSSCPLFLM